jgi:hypothetical protein
MFTNSFRETTHFRYVFGALEARHKPAQHAVVLNVDTSSLSKAVFVLRHCVFTQVSVTNLLIAVRAKNDVPRPLNAVLLQRHT